MYKIKSHSNQKTHMSHKKLKEEKNALKMGRIEKLWEVVRRGKREEMHLNCLRTVVNVGENWTYIKIVEQLKIPMRPFVCRHNNLFFKKCLQGGWCKIFLHKSSHLFCFVVNSAISEIALKGFLCGVDLPSIVPLGRPTSPQPHQPAKLFHIYPHFCFT